MKEFNDRPTNECIGDDASQEPEIDPLDHGSQVQPGEAQEGAVADFVARSGALDEVIVSGEEKDSPEESAADPSQAESDEIPETEAGQGVGGAGGGRIPPAGGSEFAGEGGEEPREDNDRSVENPEQAELANVPAVVDWAIDAVVQDLRENTSVERGKEFKDLVGAVGDIHGIETAHSFAATTCDDLQLSGKSRFEVWVNLAKEGDKAAIAEARENLERANTEETVKANPTGEITVSKIVHADNLVRLVEAGDAESMEAAQTAATDVPPDERAGFLGRLYCAGNEALLEPTLEAASAAQYDALTRPQSRRQALQAVVNSENALRDIGLLAADKGDIETAVRAADAITTPLRKAAVHTRLYVAGRKESLTEVEELIRMYQPALPYTAPMERGLAEAGHGPTIEKLRERTNAESDVRGNRVNDLRALHKAGDPEAADKIVEIIRATDQLNLFTPILAEIGKQDVALELLEERRQGYIANGWDTLLLDRDIVALTYNEELWRSVFVGTLQDDRKYSKIQGADKRDFIRSIGERPASLIRQLATRYRQAHRPGE